MEYVHGGDIYTYGDVLDFSVNVNPYGPSEEVLEAAKRSMDEVSLYPDSQCRRLRKRLAEKKSLPEEYFLSEMEQRSCSFLSFLQKNQRKHCFQFRLSQNKNRHFGR